MQVGVRKNLVLLGMMGVGKTTLGKIVAKKIGFKFIDTDANIEENCLMRISAIFKRKGEKNPYVVVQHKAIFFFTYHLP